MQTLSVYGLSIRVGDIRRTLPKRNRVVSGIAPIAVAGVVGYLVFTRGPSLLAALTAVPPWAIAGAVAAHLLTLSLRTEAWRTVLRAVDGRRLDPGILHAANAGAFLAGTVQGQAAMPTRIMLLRRFGGDSSPTVRQIALADAPIVIFEICGSAILAAIGSTTVGMIPAWAPWAMLGAAFTVLAALRLLYSRFRHLKLAAGLAVLAQPALRNRLAVVVAGFTAMAFVRTLIVLAGFGLPTDPAHVCLVLFTMGAVGLLPLGVATGPAAMVAALGTTNLVTATAAGMVVSAATVLAVLIYAGLVWTWRRLATQADLPSTESV